MGQNWSSKSKNALAFGNTELPEGSQISYARVTLYETAEAAGMTTCVVMVGTNGHAEDSLCVGLDCMRNVGGVVAVGSESPNVQGRQPILTVEVAGCTFKELSAGRVGVDVFYQ
jgi:hypothetical protein